VSYYCPCYPTPYTEKQDWLLESEKEDPEVFITSENQSPLFPLESTNFHRTLTTQVGHTSLNERPPLRSHLTYKHSEKLAKKSQALMENAIEGSGKDELKKVLLAQLRAKNHIINQLVKVFHKKFEEVFGDKLRSLENLGDSQVYEEIFNQIFELAKRFIKVLRKFLMWIYKELIKQFKKVLKEEDLSPEYVMEYVSYGVLFSHKKTTFNRLIKGLLQKIYNNEIEKLNEKFSKKRTQKLQEYDTYLKASTIFLMNNNPLPYENVTKKISELQFKSNPYEKFESILSLESEMLKGLERYHRTEIETKSQLKGNFGLDMKAPILLYCLVRSQNLDLIIDRILIDKFVNQDYLSKVQNFTTFAACLDFLLQNEELPSKIEERMTIVGMEEIEQNEEFGLKVES